MKRVVKGRNKGQTGGIDIVIRTIHSSTSPQRNKVPTPSVEVMLVQDSGNNDKRRIGKGRRTRGILIENEFSRPGTNNSGDTGENTTTHKEAQTPFQFAIDFQRYKHLDGDYGEVEVR